jgi:hypothetical protein
MSEEQHHDLLGREVRVDDTVAFVHTNSMYVGKVIKVTPKQVRIVPMLTKYREHSGYLKYTSQCVLIGGSDLTMWILKKS